MRPFIRLMALMLAVLMLAACGFHLRGQTIMPFKALYLKTENPDSPFIAELRHNLEANHVQLLNTPEHADVVLDIVSENSDKQILTLSGSGHVTEYRLIYRVSLRAYDLKQQSWIPSEEMEQRRDYIYDDSKVLAKEYEEALLIKSMRSDTVQQIVRRLSRAKPQSDDR